MTSLNQMGDVYLGVLADSAEFVVYADTADNAVKLCQQKATVESQWAQVQAQHQAIVDKVNTTIARRTWTDQIKAWFKGAFDLDALLRRSLRPCRRSRRSRRSSSARPQ